MSNPWTTNQPAGASLVESKRDGDSIDPTEPSSPPAATSSASTTTTAAAAEADVSLVYVDVVRKGVRLGGGDGRDVFFVLINGGDDLHDGGEEGRLHCLADLGSFCTKCGKTFSLESAILEDHLRLSPTFPDDDDEDQTHTRLPGRPGSMVGGGRRGENRRYVPLSVLGSATVTRTVHVSQQTSSSPLPHVIFLRFPATFSMNCTDTWPRPPPPPPPPAPPPWWFWWCW